MSRLNKYLQKFLIVFLALVIGVAAGFNPAFAQTTFTDVPESHWGYTAVTWAEENGYVVGELNDDGTSYRFRPDDSITRAEFSMVMQRLLQKPVVSEHPFLDLTENWYVSAVASLYNAGVIKGTSDTTFEPGVYITREAVAVMFDRAIGLPAADDNTFPDKASISDWAFSGVSAVQQAGLMSGDERGYFNPLANITRAEVCQVLYNYMTIGIGDDETPLAEEPEEVVEETTSTTSSGGSSSSSSSSGPTYYIEAIVIENGEVLTAGTNDTISLHVRASNGANMAGYRVALYNGTTMISDDYAVVDADGNAVIKVKGDFTRYLDVDTLLIRLYTATNSITSLTSAQVTLSRYKLDIDEGDEFLTAGFGGYIWVTASPPDGGNVDGLKVALYNGNGLIAGPVKVDESGRAKIEVDKINMNIAEVTSLQLILYGTDENDPLTEATIELRHVKDDEPVVTVSARDIDGNITITVTFPDEAIIDGSSYATIGEEQVNLSKEGPALVFYSTTYENGDTVVLYNLKFPKLFSNSVSSYDLTDFMP